ncbi:hypothetical protein JK635_02355 [Neobacillus sp. YIM B02564]|uniref:DUF4338 domain-containing protein n=1 Tax=Neobacillus paridis TaxID=2803862 RepID=A0ABS1TIE3_9BACI|nr:hypothetical protein [Neobacillus paridis]MBL4951082.1 hypothetical protein [Neobacillus paridis]
MIQISKIKSFIQEEHLTKDLYHVKEVELELVKQICREKHYLHRVPSIVASYGLYRNELLMGIITFGVPPSPYLMKICGEEYKKSVLELNRLWCFDESPRNSESFLISQGIKLLKRDKPEIKILVSFADTREGHLGYIYQATNWNFTGWSIPGGGSIVIDGKEYHPKNLNNKYNTSDLNKLKEILGTQNIFYRPRSKKCRYVKFISDKRENKKLASLCKYPIQDGYPKTLPDEIEYKTKRQKLMDKKADDM